MKCLKEIISALQKQKLYGPEKLMSEGKGLEIK